MLLFMTLGQNKFIDKLRRRLKNLLLSLLKPLDKKPGRGEACHYTIPQHFCQQTICTKIAPLNPEFLTCNIY